MKTRTKVIIGAGLVAGTGLAFYGYKKHKNSKGRFVDEYLLESKEVAEEVLNTLNESAEKYGSVSLVDYYDLIGIGASFTDNGFGWSAKSLHKAKIKKVRGGWMITFPRVESLDCGSIKF